MPPRGWTKNWSLHDSEAGFEAYETAFGGLQFFNT